MHGQEHDRRPPDRPVVQGRRPRPENLVGSLRRCNERRGGAGAGPPRSAEPPSGRPTKEEPIVPRSHHRRELADAELVRWSCRSTSRISSFHEDSPKGSDGETLPELPRHRCRCGSDTTAEEIGLLSSFVIVETDDPAGACGRLSRSGLRCAVCATTAFDSAKRTYSSMPQAVRRAVLQRDGDRCVRCGSTTRLEVDHVLPVPEGRSTPWRTDAPPQAVPPVGHRPLPLGGRRAPRA